MIKEFENLENIPAPLRFNRTNTTVEVTLKDINIPHRNMLEYFRVLTDSGYAFLLAGKRNFCPNADHRSKKLDMSAQGNIKTLRFKARQMTKFKVYETEPNERLKILFHSTYDQEYTMTPSDNTTKWKDILRAFNESFIFNITYRALVNPDKVSTCPTTEYFPVPTDFCHHNRIFYNANVVKPAVTQMEYCSIQFSDQIKHYFDLWDAKSSPLTSFSWCIQPEKMNLNYSTEFVGTELEVMYPNYFPCHKAHGKNTKDPPCFDDRVNKISFKENGRGEITEMIVGRSDNNNSIDFNLTIEFDKWTSDYGKFFTETFRDCGYEMDGTYLEMMIYIKDIIVIPERGPPGWLFPFGIITIIFLVVLATALLCLVSFGCLKKGFDLHLWRFYKENNDRKWKKMKDQENKELLKTEKSFDNPAYEN